MLLMKLSCLPLPPPLQLPTEEAMQFAGVDRGQVAALGPDTLVVLALPAWHGFLYSTHARWVGGKWVCTSQCCNAVFSL